LPSPPSIHILFTPAEWPTTSPSQSTMILSWHPVTRKLTVVLVTAAASAALYLAINRFNKPGGNNGGGGETAVPVAPEAKTPVKRRRRRGRSAANSPNARNAASSSTSASSLDSNTAPGISAAQSVADPSSSQSASMETHSERVLTLSPSAGTPAESKGADQEEQLPRTSLCGCRVLEKGEPIPDTEALFDASKRPVIGETSPVVDYKQFEPLRLCDPILDRKTEVTPASKRPPALQIEQSYLTPFQSILQSLEFADKHA
ncbi:hypothetical protein PMAYCL1PPCAC_11675, partial [Pristionchus mayeri]